MDCWFQEEEDNNSSDNESRNSWLIHVAGDAGCLREKIASLTENNNATHTDAKGYGNCMR
jgi:hypothetical protein